MNHKTCTTCGKTLPATAEYFYRDKTGRFGLSSSCRTCRKAVWAGYRQNNREKLNERNRAYRQKNREKLRAKSREWYQNNREKKAEYYQNNREKIAAFMREWYQNNRERAIANAENYRARLLAAAGFHTATDIMKKYNSQDGKCFYCGKELNYEFDVDHYVPISKGGTNWPDNLVVACQFCNRSKKDKLPEEFKN